MLLGFMALVTAAVHMVSGQVRGGGGQILHRGEPDTQSVIVTDKTRAFLSCENGDMVVKVNFSQPFRGLVYAHRSRNSPCRMHGSGQLYVELRIPLKGCGTWQESPRVFVNNITIRFHPALELEEDETKTVVCRYPPPLTPSPGSIQVVEPPTIGPSTVPTRLGKARLSELEILIIICLLLFLSLLTLGIGIAYFCLRRRNIRIVRKHTLSSAPPSQITRLSSSNLQAPPSSLLSSVLGHTVRIPRAVPYSAPGLRTASSEQAYEDYPASSSTAEASSGELSETSASSSSLADDKVDSSRRLLYKKAPRSFLFIPKAILRKTSPRRWPSVHHTHSKIVRPAEREDQIVTTVLGSEFPLVEEDPYWRLDETEEEEEAHTTPRKTKVVGSVSESPIPVYAQVEKTKKTSTRDKSPLATKSEIIAPKPTTVSTPEISKTTEEVTKNTTVTTSVRREVKETVLLATKRPVSTEPASNKEKRVSAPSNGEPGVHRNDATTAEKKIVPSPKKLLIRDVADVFVTTTVETESRELKTKTTKDTIQSKRRRQQDSIDKTPPPNPPQFSERLPSDPFSSISPELVERPESRTKSSPPETSDSTRTSPSTDGWNVVIRQRKPPPSTLTEKTEQGTDLDSMEQNEDNSTTGRENDTLSKPQFDVKIRTIPPTKLDSKPPDEMFAIPPLEMPQTVSRLKEALMSGNRSESKSPPTEGTAEKKMFHKATPKTAPSQRTVRWMDEPKESEGSTVSSSDSFHSAESLRERSSSEVLEVAPTLPSQRRGSAGRPSMLERSTSEIETSPEDSQVRWIGGVVPPLESLARPPSTVVARAGFFGGDKDRPG